MLLDDLAQPMNYDSLSRRYVVELLMDAIKSRRISPQSKKYLLKYPPSVERLILLARSDKYDEAQRSAAKILNELISELSSYSLA
jgi:hypothetical protein